MKVYTGIRTAIGCTVVTQDTDSSLPGSDLRQRQDLRNHSPDGFEWGYAGSGPAQLALALLADCLGDEKALLLYQDFKFAFVVGWPHHGWQMTEDAIRKWAAAREAA